VDGVEVGFGGLPVVGDFHEDGGDQAQATFWGGEDGDDAGSAADLFVEGFAEVGGAEAFSDGLWEGEDGEALGEIMLHPRGELRSVFLVFQDGEGEQIAGRLKTGRLEDGSDVGSDGMFHFLLWNVGLGVLLEVELAAIPRDGREDGGEGGLEAFVGVTGDGAGDSEATIFETGEELAPVDFGFGEGDGGAEDGAFAVGAVDADGGEDGTGAHYAGRADFFITGIDDDVGHGGDGAVAPGIEHDVELLGGAADLGGGDFQTAELFENFGDAAGGDALDIHFGDSKGEGPFAALASFQSRGEEGGGGVAGLGDEQIQGADTGVEGAGLEAIGVASALVVTLVGSGVEVVISLNEHGVIDEKAQGIREAVETVFKDTIEDFGIKGSMVLFGHGMCLVLISKPHQTTCDRTLTTPFFWAIRWPEFLAVPLRSTARNSGQRMTSFAAFTDKRLHYRYPKFYLHKLPSCEPRMI